MKYVVISGHCKPNTNEIAYEECIGIFDDCNMAVGCAYCALDSAIDDMSRADDLTISPAKMMELDRGYILQIVGDCCTNDFAKVYFYEGCNE